MYLVYVYEISECVTVFCCRYSLIIAIFRQKFEISILLHLSNGTIFHLV